MAVRIEIDDLTRPQVHELLREHLANMYEISPPESVHALDLSKLRGPGITFWSAWDGPVLLGCGALKELDPKHGEVKSMRTPAALRRRGAAKALAEPGLLWPSPVAIKVWIKHRPFHDDPRSLHEQSACHTNCCEISSLF